jgi:hypothetical protein
MPVHGKQPATQVLNVPVHLQFLLEFQIFLYKSGVPVAAAQ